MFNSIQTYIKTSSFQHNLFFSSVNSSFKKFSPKIVSVALVIFTAITAVYLSYRAYKYYKVTKIPSNSVNNSVNKSVYPTVPKGSFNWRKTFIHVNILNAKGYQIDGKKVSLRSPNKSEKIQIDREGGNTPDKLLRKLEKSRNRTMSIQVIDATTDEVIANENHHKIALNFANAKHAGGGPGIYKDSKTGKIVYQNLPGDLPFGSAFAQEEALVAKSTLFLSLLAIGTISEKRDDMIRNYYTDGKKYTPFDSTTTAFVSDDQLFAVRAKDDQGDYDFYQSQFLKEPVDVSFVTSAAKDYKKIKLDEEGDKVPNYIDLCYGSDAYVDAEMRIQTHLYAAAKKAVQMRKKDPNKPVELILGAFGCGAFAPANDSEYAEMIANIYKQELPKFVGFFDKVTFAIPKNLGTDKETNKRSTDNFNVFFKTLKG